MQFSFPSVSTVAAPKTSDISAANSPANASSTGVAGGFADLLAGAANSAAPGTSTGPSAAGAAKLPAGAAPVAAAPTAKADGYAAGTVAANVLAAAGAAVAGVTIAGDAADDVSSPDGAGAEADGATTDANRVRQDDLVSMMMALWGVAPNSPTAPVPDGTGRRTPTTGTTGSVGGGVTGTATAAAGEPTGNLQTGTVGQGALYARFDIGNPAGGPVAPVVNPALTPDTAPTGTSAMPVDPLVAQAANAAAVPSPAAALAANATVPPGSAPAFMGAGVPSNAGSPAAGTDKGAATVPLAGANVPAGESTAAAAVVSASSTPSSPAFAAATLVPNGAAAAAAASAAATARRVPVGTEKFAVPVAGVGAARKTDGVSDFKTMLPSKAELLKSESPGVGIGAAEPDATMPAGSTLERPSPSDTAAVLAPHAVSDAKTDAGLPASVALPTTAHRAVEAVLSATERFAAREQSSVTLRFSVGNNDLNVRVEMRAGEVHTTFRTDSPELRAALSAEWQSSTSGGDRGVRLAPPVFASSDQQGMSSSGEGASRQRDQQASQPSPGFTFTSTRANGSSSAPSGNTAATAPTPAARPFTSRHLQTLA